MMIDRARALLRWRSHDLEHGSAIPEPTTKLLTAAAPTPDRPSRQVGSVIYEVPYRLRQMALPKQEWTETPCSKHGFSCCCVLFGVGSVLCFSFSSR
ncbi:hypothetical protein V6N12_000315 [Hibiscus sabdariffa]|uniref:Uncharacterized protein n=1 Tax=Hibiscus sabdariffa TaxID=183260 RepID=A0ABR2AIY4_9ROSI